MHHTQSHVQTDRRQLVLRNVTAKNRLPARDTDAAGPMVFVLGHYFTYSLDRYSSLRLIVCAGVSCRCRQAAAWDNKLYISAAPTSIHRSQNDDAIASGAPLAAAG